MPPSDQASHSAVQSAAHGKSSRIGSKSTGSRSHGHSQDSQAARAKPDSKESEALQERAKTAYDRLKVVGLPDSIDFDAFLGIYDESRMSSSLKKDGPGGLAARKGEQPGYMRGKWSKTTTDDGRPGIGEVLDRLSERLLGRVEVVKARREIALAQARGNVEDLVAEQEAKRERLVRVLAAVRCEWDDESAKIREAETMKAVLEEKADTLRERILFFKVLERNGNLRMKRVGSVKDGAKMDGLRIEQAEENRCSQGIGDLLDDLSVSVASTMKEIRDVSLEVQGKTTTSISSSPKRNWNKASFKHTTVALANLYVYHSRLKRVEVPCGVPDSTSRSLSADVLEERLEAALRGIGVQSGAELRDLKLKIVGLAQRRAVAEKGFPLDVVGGEELSVTDLEAKQAVVESKKKEVQRLMKRIVAQGWICEQYVDVISTFRRDTAPTLNEKLRKERKRVEGHMDLTKAEILRGSPSNDAGFAEQVRQVMRSSRRVVWEDVEDAFKVFSRLPSLELKRVDDSEPLRLTIPEYSQLLGRKISKAEYGYGIAEEVRRLLEGSKRLKIV